MTVKYWISSQKKTFLNSFLEKENFLLYHKVRQIYECKWEYIKLIHMNRKSFLILHNCSNQWSPFHEHQASEQKIFTVNIFPHFTSESIYDKLVFKPKNTSIMEKIYSKQTDFFSTCCFPLAKRERREWKAGKKREEKIQIENRNFTLNLSNNKLFNLRHQYLIDLKIN